MKDILYTLRQQDCEFEKNFPTFSKLSDPLQKKLVKAASNPRKSFRLSDEDLKELDGIDWLTVPNRYNNIRQVAISEKKVFVI